MNKSVKRIVSQLLLSIGLIFTLFVSGCSDDKPAKPEHNYFDHSHGADVTDLEKHKFEHQFANQCVKRETKNSINKDIDKKRYEKPCLCIAKRMMKDLTAVEAEKFLVENKNTQSLRMAFDEAAYFCLQEKAKKIKSPKLFGKK